MCEILLHEISGMLSFSDKYHQRFRIRLRQPLPLSLRTGPLPWAYYLWPAGSYCPKVIGPLIGLCAAVLSYSVIHQMKNILTLRGGGGGGGGGASQWGMPACVCMSV